MEKDVSKHDEAGYGHHHLLSLRCAVIFAKPAHSTAPIRVVFDRMPALSAGLRVEYRIEDDDRSMAKEVWTYHFFRRKLRAVLALQGCL